MFVLIYMTSSMPDKMLYITLILDYKTFHFFAHLTFFHVGALEGTSQRPRHILLTSLFQRIRNDLNEENTSQDDRSSARAELELDNNVCPCSV